MSQEELAYRTQHLASLLVTEWLAISLGMAALVWVVNGRLRSTVAREYVLVATSLALLAWFASLPVAAVWLLYALVFYTAVEHWPRRLVALPVVFVLLAVMAFGPILAIDALGEQGRHVREFVAFATNMAFLRFYAYCWDRWHENTPREPLVRFLLAMFFFPTFINGPVEVSRALRGSWDAADASARRAAARGGLGRVLAGAGKILIAGLAFEPGWTSVLRGGTEAPVVSLWLWGGLLYAWFYLSFSGWSDMAIGLGRLSGRRVQENFASPWRAADPADFWRRWHLSLGLWLRDFVYIPLGGNRRHRRLNVLATFLVSVVWHIWGSVKLLGLGFFGPHAWGGFALWGLLNAAGVIAARRIQRGVSAVGAWGVPIACVGTFLFASLCWVPFFFPPGLPLGDGVRILLRMIWPF